MDDSYFIAGVYDTNALPIGALIEFSPIQGLTQPRMKVVTNDQVNSIGLMQEGSEVVFEESRRFLSRMFDLGDAALVKANAILRSAVPSD